MKTHISLWFGCFSALACLYAQENPLPVRGTVTTSYEALRALERGAEVVPGRNEPMALLQAAHYKVDLATAPATIIVTMRVQQFMAGTVSTPILPSDCSINDLQPADAPLLVKGEQMHLVTEQAGKQELRFRLFPVQADAIVCLPCASATISFAGLTQGEAVECKIDDTLQILRVDGTLGIPARGASLSWKKSRAVEQQAMPPSEWTWRHEVVVREQEGRLSLCSFSQAETHSGNSSEAQLILPADVSQIEVSGDNLDHHFVQREADGTQRLSLRWKGERQLNRAIELRYEKRVSALQETWLLVAPRGIAGKEDLAQFHLADQAHRKFSGEAMSGPFAPQTLSPSMQKHLYGNAYFLIDAPKGQASIQQKILPIASTADAMITKARWDTRAELDGSTLSTGQLELQYRNGARLPLRLPENAVLLSCSANQKQLAPVIAAPGMLEISLPQNEKEMATITLTISYTERIGKFAPLEGQISLRLPSTPYFINSLQWQIILPAEYAAEVAGNLTRPNASTAGPNQIMLEKNLCREETPQAEIFYNRNNKLNR